MHLFFFPWYSGPSMHLLVALIKIQASMHLIFGLRWSSQQEDASKKESISLFLDFMRISRPLLGNVFFPDSFN
jgi:hypothetical protein